MAYQQLVSYDWAQGLAGTGKVDFGSGYTPFEAYGPQVAESWKLPDSATWIYQIRKGMHYALDPNNEASRLMNGRELTADDVVWNIWRLHFDPKFPNSGPRSSIPRVVQGLSVEKTGPWEVTVKTPLDPFVGFFWIHSGGCSQMMYAKEVIEKYGNADDWKRVVGTGPWIWTDYVPQSVATFTRNPNYWERNPVGPGKGDKVPYADTLKQFIVVDLSTRLAAIRTGRADWITGIEGEDARGLFKGKPELQYKRLLPGATGVIMKTDKAEVPFKDVRVRQALMLATDFEAFARDFYEGDAEIFVYPIAPTYKNMYVPPEQLPESVRALYKYNPEKAKQLLAEAGYPKGFKTRMLVWNISEQMDPASAFKAMWAKVGVDVELQPRDRTTYLSMITAYSWTDLSWANYVVGDSFFANYSFRGLRPQTPGYEWFDDVIAKAFNDMQPYTFLDFPKADEIYKKIVPHVMEQAIMIPRPTPYSYTIWQPWIKNHYGETNYRLWTHFAWVDQDLKEKMTGRR